jgi:hypothetical protein
MEVRGTTYWWKHRQHGGDEETRQESNSRAQKLDRMRGKAGVSEEEEEVFVGKERGEACEESHIKRAH